MTTSSPRRKGSVKKIPPGVGPKQPQVLILVGATGDLSRRKLLPGLFHLASSGFIPGCRIIAVSLDELDVDDSGPSHARRSASSPPARWTRLIRPPSPRSWTTCP